MERTKTAGLSRGARDQAPVEGTARAVILAGVHAWGGNVLDELMPRSLLPIGDRPLIAHILGWLRDGGLRRVSVCANSGTAALRKRLGEGRALGVDLEYYEDVLPRGPAGCVRDAMAGRQAAACVVVDGTLIPELDLPHLVRAHQASGAAITVVAAPPDSGIAGADSPLEPLGIYVFSRSALEAVPASGYQDIKEALIPRLYAQGLRVAVHVDMETSTGRITDAPSYLAVHRSMLRRIAAAPPTPGYVALGESRVHHSARLDPSARLVGPVLIGPGSVVNAGAIVSGPTRIGAECTVGAGAVLSRSVLWEHCELGEGAVIDHCLLTNRAGVSPGSVMRNAVIDTPRLRPHPFWKRLGAHPRVAAGAGRYRPLSA